MAIQAGSKQISLESRAHSDSVRVRSGLDANSVVSAETKLKKFVLGFSK